jgi:hypothetical protein
MRYIDQDKIYELTEQGRTIFTHYFSEEEIKNPNHKVKVREDEKTASARISWHQGFWRITDFGNQSELNGARGIEFVKWKEHLTHYDALLFIEQVIIKREVEQGKFKSSKFAADYEYREMTPDDRKGAYNFTFKEHPSPEDLSAIGRYVTEDHLEHYYGKSVEKYEYCGNHKKLNRDVVHIFTSTADFPIFLFDYGEFKKLYKPHEQEKGHRFQYIGKKPTEYIFGLKQILDADNEFAKTDADDSEEVAPEKPKEKPECRIKDLFRCSGESDAINLFSIGFHAYWLNSETKDFTWQMYKQVNDLCEKHYQVMDLDATGQNEALRNALKHIDQYTVELPSWIKYKSDWRGNPCKDLKDFINIAGHDEDSTRYEILVLKHNAVRVKFWHKQQDKKSKKENYNLNMEDFFFFLKCNGFYQMDSVYHTGADYCYVKLDGKAATLIHPDQIKRLIKRFTKEWIRSKKLMDAKQILNKLNGSTQLNEAMIDGIEKINLIFKNHDRNTEYLHFRNCSVRISRDKIESIKQTDVPNHVLGELKLKSANLSHLINRNFRISERPAIEITATPLYQQLLDKMKEATTEEARAELNIDETNFRDIDKYEVKVNDNFFFMNFLRDLSRIHWRKEVEKKQELTLDERKEENLMLANLCFVLGYHCAQYKEMGKPWFTLVQDYLISAVGTASGGSGKSLLTKAITYVVTSFYKGGKKLADKNVWQFFYDGYTEFHNFIEVDDLDEYADIRPLYSEITGKREINPKNYTGKTLEYEDSGKLLISSNYELLNVEPSAIRRILNCAVSDYYHEKTKNNDYHESRSPLTKFGRSLYADFTDEEWVKFYNLICYCIQLQHRFFKIQPPMVNLERRQLRRAMATGLGKEEEFLNWASDYCIKYPGTDKPEISPDNHAYLNTYFVRNTAFLNFKTTLTRKQADEYKANKFKTHLRAWCEYKGYELNPDRYCTDKDNNRIVLTRDNDSKEYFYISTTPKDSTTASNQDPVILPPEDDILPF